MPLPCREKCSATRRIIFPQKSENRAENPQKTGQVHVRKLVILGIWNASQWAKKWANSGAYSVEKLTV